MHTIKEETVCVYTRAIDIDKLFFNLFFRGGIYLNECFVFSLSICVFFLSLSRYVDRVENTPTLLTLLMMGFGIFFDFFSGFVLCFFFLLSPVHRLDKELGRLPFFSFFFPVCVLNVTHTHTQPAVYSSLKYSTPPLACCRLVRLLLLLLSGGGEKKEKKRKTLLPSHHSPDQRDIPPRAQFVNILKTRSLTETDN